MARAYSDAMIDAIDVDALRAFRASLDEDSTATGTVIRSDVLRGYATDAGFSRVEILPIEHGLWKFYLLASWARRFAVILPRWRGEPSERTPSSAPAASS